jgi:hypothetical protein
VFHAAGPDVRNAATLPDGRKAITADHKSQLASCYTNVLEQCLVLGIHSVVFPGISTGIYEFPPEIAAVVAMTAVRDWLKKHPTADIHVVFCAWEDAEPYLSKFNDTFNGWNVCNASRVEGNAVTRVASASMSASASASASMSASASAMSASASAMSASASAMSAVLSFSYAVTMLRAGVELPAYQLIRVIFAVDGVSEDAEMRSEMMLLSKLNPDRADDGLARFPSNYMGDKHVPVMGVLRPSLSMEHVLHGVGGFITLVEKYRAENNQPVAENFHVELETMGAPDCDMIHALMQNVPSIAKVTVRVMKKLVKT